MNDQIPDRIHDHESTAATGGNGDPAPGLEALRHNLEHLRLDLTTEMTTIRKGVEAAFDQFDRQGTPVDYSADLGRIVDQLGSLTETIHAFETLPVLQFTPADITRAAEKGGEGLVRSLATQVEEAKRDLVREAGLLSQYTKSARTRETQTRALWISGLTGVAAGIASILLIPHVLPYALDTQIAAAVMWQDRWTAGAAIMRAGNPKGAEWLADANELALVNKDALETCRKAVKDTGKDQKCTITVPVNRK